VTSGPRPDLTSASRPWCVPSKKGDDRFTITLARDQDHGGGIMEMATTGYSADDIAALRARRILLDESLPAATPRQFGSGRDSMLESLVRGLRPFNRDARRSSRRQ
jgi:hypothetical protein